MHKEILCTPGPASMSKEVIGCLQESGSFLFRNSLSHAPLDKVRSAIGLIPECTFVPIRLDSEGARIRTGNFIDRAVRLRENSAVRLHRAPVIRVQDMLLEELAARNAVFCNWAPAIGSDRNMLSVATPGTVEAGSSQRLQSAEGHRSATRILYVASASRSGNTLLAFLVNTHPDIFTVSHTTGWAFGENEDFRCSCGLPLPECPFYSRMAAVFCEHGLPFKFNDFGTHYRVVAHDRLNSWLTAGLPMIQSNRLEKVRDALIMLVPGFASRLRRQDRANQVFVDQALAYSGAQVFADTSQTPHRLRHLRRIANFDISALHLVRDPRGVAASQRRDFRVEPGITARNWLRTQLAILRVLEEFSPHLTVYYEDLAERPAATLASIYSFVGLEPYPLPDDFRQSEHHILGNDMRGRREKISRDERWKTELSAQEIDVVVRQLEAFEAARPRHPLSVIVRRYLDMR